MRGPIVAWERSPAARRSRTVRSLREPSRPRQRRGLATRRLGSGQNAFDRPPATETALNRVSLEPEEQTPFADREGLTVVGQPAVGSPVAGLLKTRGPAAVSRLTTLSALFALAAGVVAVIVDAIDAVVVVGDRPHVFEEVRGRGQPALADANTSPAVVLPGRAFRVVASADHAGPGVVLDGIGLTVLSVGGG